MAEEGCRQEVGDGGFGDGAVGGGEEDAGGWRAELVDGLAACSARLAGFAVEVDDDDCTEPEGGAVEGYGGGDGILLGTGGEAIGGVFDVAAGNDGAVVKEDGRADVEVAIRGVGVAGGGEGTLLEVGDLAGGKGTGVGCKRHDESEAIGCGNG